MADSDELEPGLPPELPEEKLQPLLDTFANGARKLGLYVRAMVVNIEQPQEHSHPAMMEPRHMLVAQFDIGDQAFSTRVQDPESDQIDTEFKKIAGNSVNDDVDRIRRQYMEGDGEARPPQ